MGYFENNIKWVSRRFFNFVYDIIEFFATCLGGGEWEFDGWPEGAGLFWSVILIIAIGVIGLVFSFLNKFVRRLS